MGRVKTFSRLALVGVVAVLAFRALFGFYSSFLTSRPLRGAHLVSDSQARLMQNSHFGPQGGNKDEWFKKELDIDAEIAKMANQDQVVEDAVLQKPADVSREDPPIDQYEADDDVIPPGQEAKMGHQGQVEEDAVLQKPDVSREDPPIDQYEADDDVIPPGQEAKMGHQGQVVENAVRQQSGVSEEDPTIDQNEADDDVIPPGQESQQTEPLNEDVDDAVIPKPDVSKEAFPAVVASLEVKVTEEDSVLAKNEENVPGDDKVKSVPQGIPESQKVNASIPVATHSTARSAGKLPLVDSGTRQISKAAAANLTEQFKKEIAADREATRLERMQTGPPSAPIGPDSMRYELKVDPREFKSFEDALAKMADKNKTVILSLVDAGFVDFALNFYSVSIHRLNLTNYLPVCLDHTSWATLKNHGISCFLESRITLSGGGSNSSGDSASDFGTEGYYHKTNLKTRMALEALILGYNVLVTDIDVVLFKNPFPYFTCQDCDIHVQMDRVHWNSGFVFARATPESVRLYKLAWAEYQKYKKSHDQSYFNMARDIMMLNNSTLKAHELSARLFPCGVYYFEGDNRMFFNTPECTECIMAHNNYLGSTAAKIYRFRENLLWLVDADQYYSDPKRRFLSYENPWDFGDKSLEVERGALRNALAIGELLNRTVILPSFRCCNCERARCDHQRHRCSLLNVVNVKNFDVAFKYRYREHSFLLNPQVASNLNGSQSELLLVNSSMVGLKQQQPNAAVRSFHPGNLTTGASQSELEKWLEPYKDVSVLRFHSLYGAFATFADGSREWKFQRRVMKGLTGCVEYGQWEKKTDVLHV